MDDETRVRVDAKGRCCGRKPIHYKGGSWRSPVAAPFLFCDRCGTCYDVETGEKRDIPDALR